MESITKLQQAAEQDQLVPGVSEPNGTVITKNVYNRLNKKIKTKLKEVRNEQIE